MIGMMQTYKFENGDRVHFEPSRDTFGRVVNYTYRDERNIPESVKNEKNYLDYIK